MNQPTVLPNSAIPASVPFAAHSGASSPYPPARATESNALADPFFAQPDSSGSKMPESTPTAKPRCAHVFPGGRRCRRLPSVANACFCARHAELPENRQPADLSPELTADPAELDTFDGMHDFLAKLALLVVKDRISSRRAAVLAYITSQLLRTLSAIHREEESTPPQIIFDAPRPQHD